MLPAVLLSFANNVSDSTEIDVRHILNWLFASLRLVISLSCQSVAPVSQRSWVQIMHMPEFFQSLFSQLPVRFVHNCDDLLCT